MGFYLVREEPLELCLGVPLTLQGLGWEVEAGRPRGSGDRWNAQVNAWVGDGLTRAGAGAGGEEGKTTGFPCGLVVGARGEGSHE